MAPNPTLALFLFSSRLMKMRESAPASGAAPSTPTGLPPPPPFPRSQTSPNSLVNVLQHLPLLPDPATYTNSSSTDRVPLTYRPFASSAPQEAARRACACVISTSRPAMQIRQPLCQERPPRQARITYRETPI
ncbi:hypothetical protein MRB53_038076 [Persea americana]|nr:hypothetical protein MRB53_038076 [Persea americana]